MKKILFVQRPDSEEKNGGDHTLLLYYKSVIESKLKIDCQMYHNGIEIRQFNYVFFFNIDRPVYYSDIVDKCIQYNIPYVIYTLHHPEKGISTYLKYGTYGIRKLIAIASKNNPIQYEKYLSILKNTFNFKFEFSFDLRKIQRKIIANATYVLTSSELESLEIQNDIGKGNFMILPHYYEKKQCHEDKVQNLIVCAGRIESRKNQMHVLNIAHLNKDKEFIFIGNFNKTDSKYINKFKKKQKLLSNVKIINGLDKNEYYQYLCKAEVFISLSYFEVISLVELDAFSAGCKMIVGNQSYIKEFISGEDIRMLDFKEYKNLDYHLKTLANKQVDRNYNNLRLLNKESILKVLSKIFIQEDK